jgi:hypothetical protein
MSCYALFYAVDSGGDLSSEVNLFGEIGDNSSIFARLPSVFKCSSPRLREKGHWKIGDFGKGTAAAKIAKKSLSLSSVKVNRRMLNSPDAADVVLTNIIQYLRSNRVTFWKNIL